MEMSAGENSAARRLAPMVAAWVALLIPVLTAPVARASVEHPRLVVSGVTEKSAKQTPIISWGQIQLNNRFLGTLECVNIAFGTAQNETEPGGAGNGEDVRAYGEVDGWSASSFTNANGLEPSPRCKSSSSLEAWASAEPEPALTTNAAGNLNGAATERLVVRGPFGGTAAHREPPALPWREEAVAETVGGAEKKWLRIGIATNTTERAIVEQEEADTEVPTERRTGCYHEPPVHEVVREPGYTAPKETEMALRVPPQGCIVINVISPMAGLETPFGGTLEPEFINGTRNSLTPSHVEFKGGERLETEVGSGASERNERHLVGGFGNTYIRSIGSLKLVGYLNMALMQLK